MATFDNPYSRFVALAKVLLPLLAVMLLSVLFLFSRARGPESEIPFAEIEEIAREPRIQGPAYAGVGRNGAVLSLRAEEIRPIEDRDESFRATGLRGTVEMADGRRIEMQAGAGEFDGPGRAARLTGLARVETSDGYEIETSGIEADLEAGTLRSLGPLEVRTPFGALTAGAMQLDDSATGTGLVFTEGVRLLYIPATDP